MTKTNSPVVSRLFVQEEAGSPLKYVGCVGMRGVVIDPRQQEYARSVDETGIVIDTIQRYPNPQPFEVTFGKNYRKWQSLFKNTKRGCKPNFFIASAECDDMTRVSDPNYWDDGVWLFNVVPATGYQVGNNTIISSDPNATVKREDQMSWVPEDGVFIGSMIYGSSGTTVGNIRSIAVVDEGKCSEVICRPCDAPGCLSMLVSDGTNIEYTINGGSSWQSASPTGGAAAWVRSFNGNAFSCSGTVLSITDDVSDASWTVATTDNAFSALAPMTQVDMRTFLMAGGTGQVWRSVNGGGSWVRIKTGETLQDAIIALQYNPSTEQVIGVFPYSNGASVKVGVSVDYGKSFAYTAAVGSETVSANTVAEILCAGNLNFLLINGKLYKITCSAGVTTAVVQTLIGASGDITGLGKLDARNPNALWLTTYDTGITKIWRTNDGFSTIAAESLTFTLTGSSLRNPFTVCHSKYGDSIVVGVGKQVVKGQDWDSFFSD